MCADWATFYRLAETTELDDIIDYDFGVSGMSGLIGMITGMTMSDRAEDDSEEFEDEDSFTSLADTITTIQGLLSDGLISAEDLITEDNLDQFASAMPQPPTTSHEHDLSNWNGSPIFYPTREMARAQSDRWGMFWEYHDFGIASPTGYRYATVPRGVGPTAPDNYDWVCLPREE